MDTRVLKYEFINPKMNKKLFEEDEALYNKLIIFIRVDEMNGKGAYLIKISKPTKNGTKFTFKPCETHEEWDREFKRMKEEGEKVGITMEVVANE